MERFARRACLLLGCAAIVSIAGCYYLRTSSGGGQTSFKPPRVVRAADIAVPSGYQIEAVATGLTFPTGITFDGSGVPYVTEAGYSYGEVWTTPRLLRIDAKGGTTEIAAGRRNGPWTGVAFADDAFFVAEGGQLEGGRILRITADGRVTPLIDKLPSHGDHHTNGPAVGPDGKIYFGQGTATNSGVVGEDNFKFGWLQRFPDFHDVPCRDLELAGENFESSDPTKRTSETVKTGAFLPFGTAASKGQLVKAGLPCNGAILRINPDGSEAELVADGLRNPFGLAFAPDGQLYVAENGPDDRGSRPIWGAGDVLWRITPGTWYGWPDFAEGRAITYETYKPPHKKQPTNLLAQHPGTPPKPAAVLGVHASADGLDFSRSAAFGYAGEAFIAEFGDQAPVVGKVMHPVGYRVVRVNINTGRIEDFAVNKGRHNGPASKNENGGLERPVAVRFSPSGDALYVVDFGVMLETSKNSQPQQNTGVLWRISSTGS